MTMPRTAEIIRRRLRRILTTCGLAAAMVVGTDAPAHAVDSTEGAVHTSQPVPIVPGRGSELRDYVNSGGIGSGPVYSEGDILYEQPDGSYLPAGSPDCGYSCPASWIFTADALYLNREGDRGNSLSNAFQLNDFGFELSGRATLARRYDCLIGWEASYTGWFEWDQQGVAAGPGLAALFAANGVNLSSFIATPVAQQQTYTSFFQSAEFSQKWWGWDVIATSAGLRYINVEEDLFFNSVNAAAEAGQLFVLTNNHLVGGQIGLDLFFPVGRLQSTTKFRASAYANISDTTTVVNNAGLLQVNNAADEVDFASLLEIGYYFSYYITPRVSVRAGYEVMWLYGLAIASDQIPGVIDVNTGIDVNRNGDVFYHGGTLGVEMTW